MILDKILYKKLQTIEKDKKDLPIGKIIKNIEMGKKNKSLYKSLDQEKINIIGEIKRASPSKGIIKSKLNPVEIAQVYDKSKLAGISVLTEENYFLGKKEYLKQVKKVVDLPVLRKDFIIDSYQIYQSKYLQADAILLIARILDRRHLKAFKTLADQLNLDVLLEINGLDDLRKIKDIDFKIIGINNRDLSNFSVDLKTTEKLMAYLSPEQLVVSESGIKSRKDIDYLQGLGVKACLVGGSLMEASSIEEKLGQLLADRND